MADRFDPRELLLQRARERLEGQQEGTGNYLVLPDGCNWCRIKAEEMAFDFVPYVNKDAQHPDRVPAGVPWPRLPFWRHSNLGAENKKALCLKSVHKPCPVCEERQRLISDGADRKLTDGLRASYRELYLLLDDRDEFQVLEMAYSNFGKTLDRKIARLNNEMAMFYDLERGHTVIAWFVEESIGRSPFLEVDEIEFEKRKPIKASLLEDAPDLAECLRPLTYDRLRALYLDLDPDEVGGDADPEPTARRGRSRPEPDPEPATRRRQRTEPAPDPEPDDVPEGFTICVACEGSGKNSRGRACPICNGEGIKELADVIYMARDRKPIFVMVEGEMCSAAYWIGSSAHKIYAEKTAIIGSIGVISAHYDLSGFDAKTGIKRTYIYSGKYKAIANDAEPLSEEAYAYLKGIVDDFYGIFVEDVERNRGALSVEDVLGFESKVFIADKALSQGLIEGIGTYSQIYNQLKREAHVMNKDELKAQFPDLFKEVLAEGFSSASDEEIKRARPDLAASLKSEGAAEERSRVMGIFNEAYGKETGEKFGAIVKPGASVADMMAFAQDKAKADILAKMTKEAPESVGQETGAGESAFAGLQGEELYKAEYGNDPEIQKEYGSLDAYVAYKKAEAQGRVRLLRKKQ